MVSEMGVAAARPLRRGLVLGCGGTLGAAWTMAALLEIERSLGWDARTAAAIIGTSSGAEIASLLGTGVSVRAMVDAAVGADGADEGLVRHFASPPPSWPPRPTNDITSARLALRVRSASRGRPGVRPLVALTSLLPVGRGDATSLERLVDARVSMGGWATHPATYVVAVDLGDGQRTAFGKRVGVGSIERRPPLRDALRASWAIPGWFPPVRIDGRLWTDGGVASPTSADLLVDESLDEVVVVAPMASTKQGRRRGFARVEGLVRRAMTRTVDVEVAQLERAGVAVLRVEPSAEDLAAMGPNLMDRSRRLAVLESSLRTTRRTIGAARARSIVGTRLWTTEGRRP